MWGGGIKCKVATRRPPQLTRYNGVHRAQRVEGSVHDSGVHEVCVCVWGGGGGKCKVATRRPPQLTRYNGVHRAQRVEGSVHDSGVHEVCVCGGGGEVSVRSLHAVLHN